MRGAVLFLNLLRFSCWLFVVVRCALLVGRVPCGCSCLSSARCELCVVWLIVDCWLCVVVC